MCDKIKELEIRIPINFFGERPIKAMQTEATNNGDRGSTLNKGTKSRLTSE